MTADRLFDDDGIPSFHAADPWTSKAAARSVAVHAGTDRYRVLEVLARTIVGRTAFEVAVELEMQATTAGTRLRELVDAGAAVRTGERRPTDTGALAYVVNINDHGRELLSDAYRRRPERRHAVHMDARGSHALGRPHPSRPSRYGLTAARDRVLEELVEEWRRAQLREAPAEPGLTDHELAELVGGAVGLRTAAGTARKALERDGYVEPTGRTRATPSGRQARTHTATELGRRHFYALIRPQ